jgi:mono/diheme cytochrome c family protein
MVVVATLACESEPEGPRPPLSAQAKRGRVVFLEKAEPSCGTCHSLAHAGTRARTGPSLDLLRPTHEQIVRAVTRGKGAMPPQRAVLDRAEIEAVATYVEEARGRSRQ